MSAQTLRNLIVSLAVAGLFLYLAFRNVPLADLGTALRQFDLIWLIPAVVVSLTLQVFRAFRWQLELRPLERIGLGKLWIVTSVAYMAINLLPARLGEFVRPWLLSRRSSVKFSNVVGNLVIEKTMDSIVIVFYILVGLLTATDLPEQVELPSIGVVPINVSRIALVPAALAAVLSTLIVLVYVKGEPFVDRWLLQYLPKRFGGGLKRVLRSFLDGMLILPDGKLLAMVFLTSVVLWFLPILSSYIVILAFGFDLPFNAALMVFIFIGFATALPNAPGMVGPYQVACIIALGLFGIAKPEALAYGLVVNAIQLVTLVAQGLVALPLAGVGLADLRRAQRELQPDA